MNRVFSFFPGFCLVLLSGYILTSCNSGNISPRTYYISPSGNDASEGSLTAPWKSVEPANRLILQPGDTILFEGGATFAGTVFLDSIDSGDEFHNVVIGSYGNGKALIDGGDREGIVVDNAEYFKIRNLIIKGNGRKLGNESDGVVVTTSDFFELDNLEVYGFQHCGVLVMGSRNARLTNIVAHDNGFAGIHVTGIHANDPVLYDNENLYIGYCKAFNNPGDPTVFKNHSGNGILAASVKGGLIEFCEAFNNGWDMPWTGNGPVGIWIWDCTNFTIQYCLSHDNKTNPVAADGGGFDLDGGVSNSVIQNCISWSNQGAGYGLFEFGASKPWENNIVRYNISRNDGLINGGSLCVWKSENGGTMSNCAVYNNTFYSDTARGVALSLVSSVPGFIYRNNIFVFKRTFIEPKQKLGSEVFVGNCFWSLSGSPGDKWIKTGNIYADPLLADPRMEITPDISMLERISFSAFSLKKGSPVTGKGVDPESPYGMPDSYKGINGAPLKHGTRFEIGAVGSAKD